MLLRATISLLLVVLFSLGTASAQESNLTLWKFLGISQGLTRVRNGLVNRHGNLPGLEPKTPLKPLADASNLQPGTPNIIQQAAKVKQQEDQKLQKIKAIKYLTAHACGCYDREQKVVDDEGNETTVRPTTQALVSALQDCTEEVRFAAVRYITWAAEDGCCSTCGSRSCCREELVKELAHLAFDIDKHGCFVEPSKRVREAAERALRACCPSAEPISVMEGGSRESTDREGNENADAEDAPDEESEQTPDDRQQTARQDLPRNEASGSTDSPSSWPKTAVPTQPARELGSAHGSQVREATYLRMTGENNPSVSRRESWPGSIQAVHEQGLGTLRFLRADRGE